MPHGFPAFPQGQFPNDLPPTWFHPASPKIRPAKPAKEVDTASIASTSTFSSTVSLLKDKAKRTLPISYKDYRARKDSQEAASGTTVYSEKQSSKSTKKSLPKDTKTPRQRTAEAYMIWAATK
ncbi:uncharacterized protein LY89DRAFT_689603 [Mollisia scopiformis]|uniref:Uncharacterized protein n=1 Tax=Mollisia scopiformis TaxID=149040 RepID=A0A132BD16_MOLSC|nr:uncharacterized protein LY89DRAFT_689603 [Mollisia scopiformis]KUJ10322.1 hypothetical protein LY89DRAFT_689603 [Mollisia scopiformis]